MSAYPDDPHLVCTFTWTTAFFAFTKLQVVPGRSSIKELHFPKLSHSKHFKKTVLVVLNLLTKANLPENDETWMWCLSTAVSCPSLSFTVILLLKFSGPYCANSSLHYGRETTLWANKPNEVRSCSVFLHEERKKCYLIE